MIRIIKQTFWNVEPWLIVSLLLFITSGIVIIVIVSLIPIYLDVRDITLYRPNAGIDRCYSLKMKNFPIFLSAPFLLIYETDTSGADLSWVSNTDRLSNEVKYSSFFIVHPYDLHIYSANGKVESTRNFCQICRTFTVNNKETTSVEVSHMK